MKTALDLCSLFKALFGAERLSANWDPCETLEPCFVDFFT